MLELGISLGHCHELSSLRWMHSMASGVDTARARRGGGAGKIAAVVAKLLLICACFWYVSRQVDFSRVLAAIPPLGVGWVASAVAGVTLQIPLVALRWRTILGALSVLNERTTRAAILVITAIGEFFAQVLPSVAGDGIRAWFLVRLGCDWRNAVTSVVIDRAVGVGLLVALGFVILLLRSDISALGGYREQALVVYGALLLAGVLVFLLLVKMDGLLGRWRYSRWIAAWVPDMYRVLLGPKCPVILALGVLIHALAIAVVWSIGRSLDLMLTVPDAAVLFTIMLGVTILPISISGWGTRELAVVALLSHHGVAPEKALLLSICFGIVSAVGSLPGAFAWLVYSVAPTRARAN